MKTATLSKIKHVPSRDALCRMNQQLEAALKSAYELLARCGGTALGIAVSGKNHPNPDEKLEELFRLCDAETQKISKLLNS